MATIPTPPGNRIQLINFTNLKDFYHSKITNLFIKNSSGEPTAEVIAVDHGGTGTTTLAELKTSLDLDPIPDSEIIALFEEE